MDSRAASQRGTCPVCGRSWTSSSARRLYCGAACKSVADWLAALSRGLRLVAFAPTDEGDRHIDSLRRELFAIIHQLPVPRRHRTRGSLGRFVKRRK